MHGHYDKKVLFQAPVFVVKNSVDHQRLRSGETSSLACLPQAQLLLPGNFPQSKEKEA